MSSTDWMLRRRGPLWFLGYSLRVFACAPLSFFALVVIHELLPRHLRSPIDEWRANGPLEPAVLLVAVLFLIGLWGSLLLERSPKSPGLRRLFVVGLVPGLLLLAYCVLDVLLQPAALHDDPGFLLVFLFPLLAGAVQLALLLREGRRARAVEVVPAAS